MTCLKLIEKKCDTYLFVDDTEIFQQIRHKSIGEQSQRWLFTFQPKMCHVLKLVNYLNIPHTERYTLHRQELQHVFGQKVLEVILHTERKFDEHISMSSFSYLDSPMLRKLFPTFVRPHL